jgi:hypothetical protein
VPDETAEPVEEEAKNFSDSGRAMPMFGGNYDDD